MYNRTGQLRTLCNMMQKAAHKKYFLITCCLLFVFVWNACVHAGVLAVGAQPVATVFVGGFPIGLELKPHGVIVVGAAAVETELGSVVPQIPLHAGDVLESINGHTVANTEDIRTALRAAEDMTADVCVRRGTALLHVPMGLILEDMTGEKRLGVQVRESVMGVGTVTYVKKDGSFGCLGHPIVLENGNMAPCDTGWAYACKIVGCNKGARGKAGELKGAFVGGTPTGTLRTNCRSGVYGTLNEFSGGTEVEVAGRKSVKIGKASILATVGNVTESYDIEIIKTSVQNSVSDKSMILRVTDRRLIAATGGIVQGMSGSPILQDGKLIGAVTHVFVSDPTKGYGIYADWMLQNQ